MNKKDKEMSDLSKRNAKGLVKIHKDNKDFFLFLLVVIFVLSAIILFFTTESKVYDINYITYLNSNGRMYKIINYYQTGFLTKQYNCTYAIYQINQTSGKTLMITNNTIKNALINLSRTPCSQ